MSMSLCHDRCSVKTIAGLVDIIKDPTNDGVDRDCRHYRSLLLRLGGVTTPGKFLATQFCSALREAPGVQTEARIEAMSHCAIIHRWLLR